MDQFDGKSFATLLIIFLLIMLFFFGSAVHADESKTLEKDK